MSETPRRLIEFAVNEVTSEWCKFADIRFIVEIPCIIPLLFPCITVIRRKFG